MPSLEISERTVEVRECHTRTDTAVCDLLVSILITRHERVNNALKKSSLQPYVESRVTDFDMTGEFHVINSYMTRRSALALDEVRHFLEYEVLSLDFPNDDELAAAASMIKMLRKRFHQPWYHIPPDDDVDPAIELFQTVIWPLSDYFISLTPPPDDTVRLARSLADETVRALSTGSGAVIERALLDGVVVDHPMTVGRVALRPLTVQERHGITARFNRASSYEVQFAGPDNISGVSGTCVIEAHTPWETSGPPPASPFLVDRIILALQLIGVSVAGPGWVHTSTEPRNVELDRLRPLRLCSRAPRVEASDELISHAVSLAEQIPEAVVTEPKNRHDIALNRFLRGCAALTSSDALLEHTIALEAILLPSKFEGELGYRLRVNAAWLLGSDRDTRAQIAHKLGRIYTLRSSLVHGLRSPEDNDLKEAATWAREILCDLLRYCLEVSWPGEAELARLALG